ncbi:MAG: sugar phosphate isomerase/epimerase [Planctomycetes bacterium]|nr:sugar phosphate isomerase/epimerase [Planctomycetota bacterium]
MPLPLARCAIHTMTTKPWSLAQAAEAYAHAGVGGITVWRQHLPAGGAAEAGRIVRAAGLGVAAYCRGGFFPAADAGKRQAALDDNRRCIDEAAAVGAPQVVLVCGAVPGMPLAEARAQIRDGLAAVLDHACSAGIRLAIEPLHPLYAADRSAVSTMAQARRIAESFTRELPDPLGRFGAAGRRAVGIACDVYHVWWDDTLAEEITLAGRLGLLHGFHVCDWKAEQASMLNDRGLMGEGCIDVAGIRRQVEAAGFTGYAEVEVFSDRHWARDQQQWLGDIVRAWERV